MFDLLPSAIVDSLEFLKGVGVGSIGTVAVAYAYSHRAAIGSVFKRAETSASSEVTTLRNGLASLEDQARQAFGIVSSTSKQIAADVADVKGRIGKLEAAVFGVPANPTSTVQQPVAPSTLAPTPATAQAPTAS